jgi:hypothetical protein
MPFVEDRIAPNVPSAYIGVEEPTELEVAAYYADLPSEGFEIALQELTHVIGRLSGGNDYLLDMSHKRFTAGRIAPEVHYRQLAKFDGRTEILDALKATIQSLRDNSKVLFPKTPLERDGLSALIQSIFDKGE